MLSLVFVRDADNNVKIMFLLKIEYFAKGPFSYFSSSVETLVRHAEPFKEQRRWIDAVAVLNSLHVFVY